MKENENLKDLTKKVESAYMETRISGKSGNAYSVLVIKFLMPNGQVYSKEEFLNQEQLVILGML